jgi:tetratricopeptide (TPR) repeat protein
MNDTEPTDAGRVDLFVSHAGRDRAWAEWVAWELRQAGYRVELDSWDWQVGENFVGKMRDALERADRMVALFSEAYFEAERFTTMEWTALLTDRDAAGPRLLPFRIENVQPPRILEPLLSQDLFGVSEEEARRLLLEAVGGRRRPDQRPMFPASPAAPAGSGGRGPRLPGSLPAVWNLPLRNVAFTGRDGMIVALRERLCAGTRVVVEALHGLGGVGKTQLAIEYGHRFAGDYDLCWWIDGEQHELIGEQLTGLAVTLGLVEAGAGMPVALSAVKSYLGQHDRWLLIIDNVNSPAAVREWLPSGPGHVLITSRHHVWVGLADPLPVDVFARTESVALLRRHLPRLAETDADRLAEALGDLPLAVAQAAGLLAETGMSVSEYLQGLAEHTAQITAEGTPTDYPVSLAAAVRLSSTQLEEEDAAAGQLLRLCAFLGPEPVPLDLFSAAPDGLLPEPLAATVQTPLALRLSVGRIVGHGLARLGGDGPVLHRLIQAILRDQLERPDRDTARTLVEGLLVAAQPDDGTAPALWPRWAQLLPHILAADPAGSSNDDLRSLACYAVWNLLARGDARAALPIARQLYQQWGRRYGPDDYYTMFAAVNLAQAYGAVGDYHRARELNEDTVARNRRILGEDHQHTLASANNLAIDLRELGEFERARELDEDTLARFRRVLGPDHPNSLASVNNLAADLRQLGELERARELDEDTLSRRRRVLGEDHPQTLTSANNLANDLQRMGELERARELDEDTLTRRRRVLGEDHPDTLTSASNLAISLRQLGELERARELDEDTLTRRRRVLGPDPLTP